MKIKVYFAVFIFACVLSGCGRNSLSKSDAQALLSTSVPSVTQSFNLQKKPTPELNAAIRELINNGKLKEVGAIAGFMAFSGHGDPNEATVNYDIYGACFVKCPIITEQFGSVTSVLNDTQAGTAEVTYTMVGTPAEPYYSTFNKYSSAIPAVPSNRTESVIFKKYEEGWRRLQ